jgi:hypothetical protein
MDPKAHDLAAKSTCTSCQFTEDFRCLLLLATANRKDVNVFDSNYWTAVLYFKARNGTYKRVPQRFQQGMENTNGGMVGFSYSIYYMF